MKQRFFFEIGYNGTSFFGWQRQSNAISVQEVIEKALSQIHSGLEIPIVGCGRTDTGVHAYFFVFHADLDAVTDVGQLKFKLNRMLPSSIVLFRIHTVSIDLHARFSALKRTYRYFLHQEKSPFLPNSLYYPTRLDFEVMNEAAKQLLGTQDFTSLSKLHTDVKTNICTISVARWIEVGEKQWYFEISADRFLRNMVRATVGTLLEVGTGKITPETLTDILESKDRSEAKVSVEANGLFLWNVEY